MPLQDYAPTAVPVKTERAAKKTPAKPPVRSPPRTRRKTEKRNYQDPPTDDEEVVEETEDPLRVPLSSARGDDEGEEYVEATPDPEATNRKGKRKLAKPVIKQERNKRLRAGPSFKNEAEEGVAPTRVFALWKKTDDYYAGTVYSSVGKQVYTVNFDDGQDGDVDLDDMRKLELREGDTVFLGTETQGLKVIKVDLERRVVTVRQRNRNKEVPLRLVKIPGHEISANWGDRTLKRADEIVPMVRSAKTAGIPPSPAEGAKAKGKSKNTILARTGVVITLSKDCPNSIALKADLGNKIKDMGGTVLGDFLPHINMNGIHDRGNGRWRISKSDVQWTRNDLDRLFLVADNITQKPRYLLAIALGVPCISIQWLHDCHKCDTVSLSLAVIYKC